MLRSLHPVSRAILFQARFRRSSPTRLAVLSLGLALARLSLPASAGEWQPLFNGQDLSGWKLVNGQAPFTVENGMIVGTTVVGSPNSFLATEKSYGDFILEFEVQMDAQRTFNSGVQFRSESKADYKNGRVHGYQCEIDPSARGFSGGIYDEARRGWLYPVSLNPAALALFKAGSWVRYRIEATGPSLRTWINDQPVAHVIDDLTPSGFIALQVHAIGNRTQDAGRQIRWRHLRIQTRDLVPSPAPHPAIFVRNLLLNQVAPAEAAQGWSLLWDGKTSAGWRRANAATFPAKGWDMADGVLSILPGNRSAKQGGDIVTEKEFTDFELQFDFQLTPGANSGVKYNVQANLPPGPGQGLGLEYQVLDDAQHPDAKMGHDGNRTVASLYDLIPAAKTKPKVSPGEWHHARIVARGPHVEHWLDGLLVLTYTRGTPEYRAAVAASKFSQQPQFGEWPSGRILIQDHGDRVLYRSIKIR